MNRFNGLDSLMRVFDITDNDSFQSYQIKALSRLESEDANLIGFEWDAAQIDFTYKQLEMENQISVMAHYVDLNSPALPTGKSTKVVELTGSIPRQKYTVVRGENDYRKELIAINEERAVAAYQNRSEEEAVTEYLKGVLFTTLADLPNAHKNAMNYQVGQFKSTGKLVLDDKNNPLGSIRTTFDAHVPAANFITKNWYDASGNAIEGSNPISDIRDFIREVRWKVNGYQQVTVELNTRYAYKLFSNEAVLTEIGYAMVGNTLRVGGGANANAGAYAIAKAASFEAQQEAFKSAIGADEVIFNSTVCGVETVNKSTKKWERSTVDAFNMDTILIRPSGQIGVIKNVVPLRPDGSAISAGIFGGRGIIEYIYNADTRTQTWRSELTALAVLTRPRDMYYIKGVKA